MTRLLRTSRRVPGMPPGDVSRFRPEAQAAMILARLGADSPLAAKQIRQAAQRRTERDRLIRFLTLAILQLAPRNY